MITRAINRLGLCAARCRWRSPRVGVVLAVAAALSLVLSALVFSGCSSVGSISLFPTEVGGKWGYIDQTGRMVIQARFERVTVFSEGLAAAWSGGKAGFIDTRGRFVIEPQFDSAGSFVDDRAPVLSNMHVGFIDKSGNVAIELKYSDSAPFQEGLAPVKDNTNWGFVDPDGKLAIPATFEDVGSFTEGLARAKSDGKWGYIDKTGAWVIQPQYSEAESASPPVLHFREGLAAVYADGNWKFIDKAGTQVFEGVFHKAGEFSEGLCPVVVNVATKAGETDYRLGFIDTTGRMVIAPQFYAGVTLTNQLVVGFHSGLSPVKEVTGSGLWGYINEDGKFVIEPKFGGADSFLWGPITLALLDNQEVCIDKSGNVVFRSEGEPSGSDNPETAPSTSTTLPGSPTTLPETPTTIPPSPTTTAGTPTSIPQS